MAQSPMPTLPIERGLPGAGLLAHILVSKYCDHLPLYRQSGIYARDGVDLDRAIMAAWVGKVTALAAPLVEAAAAHVMAAAKLHADDTPVPVLAPGTGKTKTGRLWVYLRDERPYAGQGPPAVVYRYSPDRRGEHPRAHLAAFHGFLQADGYSGFGPLYKTANRQAASVSEVACWAHVRRQFYDIHVASNAPIAGETRQRIGQLFDIERAAMGRSPEQRRLLRQTSARPLIDDLAAFLDASLATISGRSDLAKAIRYARSRWTALTRYLDDGTLEISNNAAERAIRPLVLGRKNYLFAGSDAGGARAAAAYTLIETPSRFASPPDRATPSQAKRAVAVRTRLHFFPSVNYFTLLDRSLHYFSERGVDVTHVRNVSYQNSQTLTHAASAPPGHSLQKRTVVQWDMGAVLGRGRWHR